MEKVQFQLEATLPELKDLYDKGLFTKYEIDQITRRRTAFETSLIRQLTRKEDFFKYAEYEINLERLRKLRWKKLRYDLDPPPPSASTFSLPRRAMYVLKRATSKFPSDLSVWLAYVEYASRERMRKVVLKGLNTALQHHPLSSTPYLLLSYHHLHPNSPFPRTVIPSSSKQDLPSVAAEQESPSSLEGIPTARTTLLLGLRLLPKSRELWREYIKLELGWVEGLRRRWVALGIKEEVKQPDAVLEDDRALLGGSGAFGPDGESARRAILAGQLVIYALASALEAIPIQEGELEQEKGGMAFRSGLLQLFRTYPSPLRTKCLEVVYADLDVAASLASSAGETSAHAALAVLTKRLYDRPYDSSVRDTGSVVLEGVELVEEVGLIGKAIRKTAKTGDETFGEVAGHWLAKQMEECSQQDNEELRSYLFSVLTALTKASPKPSPNLLLLHLDQIARLPEVGRPSILVAARAHAELYPSNPAIQLIRLHEEVRSGGDSIRIRKTFQEVIKVVTRSDLSESQNAEVEDVWLALCDYEEAGHEATGTDMASTWSSLLRDSLRLGSDLPSLHSKLLLRYFAHCVKQGADPSTVIDRIVKTYRPSTDFFSTVFNGPALSSSTDQHLIHRRIYEAWRAVCTRPDQQIDAVLTWAAWLLDNKKSAEATRVVDAVKREVRGEGADRELEQKWKGLLDRMESRDALQRDRAESMALDDDSGTSKEESSGDDESATTSDMETTSEDETSSDEEGEDEDEDMIDNTEDGAGSGDEGDIADRTRDSGGAGGEEE